MMTDNARAKCPLQVMTGKAFFQMGIHPGVNVAGFAGGAEGGDDDGDGHDPIPVLGSKFESSKYSIYSSGSNLPSALNAGAIYHFRMDTIYIFSLFDEQAATIIGPSPFDYRHAVMVQICIMISRYIETRIEFRLLIYQKNRKACYGQVIEHSHWPEYSIFPSFMCFASHG